MQALVNQGGDHNVGGLRHGGHHRVAAHRRRYPASPAPTQSTAEDDFVSSQRGSSYHTTSTGRHPILCKCNRGCLPDYLVGHHLMSKFQVLCQVGAQWQNKARRSLRPAPSLIHRKHHHQTHFKNHQTSHTRATKMPSYIVSYC